MAQETFLNPPMPDVLAQWRAYLSLLDPQPDHQILDVGCGSGDTERLLASIYPEVGAIIGLEKNVDRYAENQAQAAQTSAKISFREGDAQALPFADDTFDRVLCVDTLEWVPDPLLALQEMRRVLKPGGVALVVHSDFDAQVFKSSKKELTRRIVHAFCDAGPNGQMGRELHGLCRSAGFDPVTSSVYALVNTEWAPDLYGYRMAHMMVDWLKPRQLLSDADLEHWFTDLSQQHDEGTFFYAINRNICRCIKSMKPEDERTQLHTGR